MSTYTDIRYDYNLPSSAGGAMKLISEQTASASASISFTSGIDSSYRTYMFKFINLHPSTDGTPFHFNLSTDGGSNYNVTKTTTVFNAYHNEADTNTILQYRSAQDLAQSTSYQNIVDGDLGADNDQNACGYLYLFNPSNTTYVKHFISNFNYMDTSDYSINVYTAGYGNTTSAIDAINFKMETGNIDAGTIKMYGIA